MTKYNEVVPLTKEQRIKEKAGWKALKYFYEPAPPADIILARNEHIERVAAPSPIQVFGEDNRGFTNWISADDLWMIEGMPAVHRTVSKYEIVLDCESERIAKFVMPLSLRHTRLCALLLAESRQIASLSEFLRLCLVAQ